MNEEEFGTWYFGNLTWISNTIPCQQVQLWNLASSAIVDYCHLEMKLKCPKRDDYVLN